MTTHSAEFTLSRMECTKTCGSDDNKHITCTGALEPALTIQHSNKIQEQVCMACSRYIKL